MTTKPLIALISNASGPECVLGTKEEIKSLLSTLKFLNIHLIKFILLSLFTINKEVEYCSHITEKIINGSEQ